MNKCYLVSYAGLYLKINSDENVFIVDINLAYEFASRDDAFDWIDERKEEFSNLSFILTVVRCEQEDDDWNFKKFRTR